MTAAPKEQPKTSEAMANELTWYDALLPYGVRMGARRPKDMDSRKGFPQSRLSDPMPGNGGLCNQDFREEI
jgi:hypothetical protein